MFFQKCNEKIVRGRLGPPGTLNSSVFGFSSPVSVFSHSKKVSARGDLETFSHRVTSPPKVFRSSGLGLEVEVVGMPQK